MVKLRVLVADDQVQYREILMARLQACSRGVFFPQFTEASTPEEAVMEAEKGYASKAPFDLVLLDINFSKAGNSEVRDGHWAASEIREVHPDVMIVLISSMTEKEHMDAVERSEIITRFFRKGKFADEELFRVAVWAALRRLHGEHQLLDSEVALHTQSDLMREFINQVDQVAPETNVMIYGETGTGKELTARRLNANARFELNQKSRPFVAVNCGGLSKHLAESELFGHVKGAFTGAIADKQGLLESANGGDLFLDELQNAPIEFQKILMRALQEKSFSPVGGSRVISVNVRAISAMNKPLAECVESGLIMQDFAARLSQCSLRIPALRERVGDTDLLAGLALEKFVGDKSFSHDALLRLRSQHWADNVRGFMSVCSSVLSASRTPIITSGFVETFLPKSMPSILSPTEISNRVTSSELVDRSIRACISEAMSLDEIIRTVEKKYLEVFAIQNNCKNIGELSRVTKLPYMTLKRKIGQLDLKL